MTLTRKYPHHGIPNHELAQIFYQGLDYQERQLVDICSGGNFLNTRASESLKRMEELVEDWVFRQSSMIDTKTGGLKRGVIDVKGMEADIKMEKLEREMKQSVIDITENFKHILKDAIATIKPHVNLNKGNSDLPCMNCTTNDHMQDKGKVILTEQVNAFGAHSNHNNWNAGNNGNKMTNFRSNSGQQGFGIQNNQLKIPNQQQFNLPYQQNNQHLYHNMHFQHSQLPYQYTQPQFYQNSANMQLPAQGYTNHAFNNNLWETVKHLQDKEKTWEEEKKLLLLQIEGLRSSQNTRMGNEVQREDKNQGKIDDNFSKRSLKGQLPTKPCINPRILLHVDRSNIFSYTSSAEISNNQKSDSSYNLIVAKMEQQLMLFQP